MIIRKQFHITPDENICQAEVVISKCIEFDHCRYDGSLIPSDFVKALKPQVDFSPVCAKMAGSELFEGREIAIGPQKL